MHPIRAACFVAVSLLFFYIGIRMGEDKSAQDRVLACDGAVHPDAAGPAGHAQVEVECPKPPVGVASVLSEIRCTHAYEQRKNLSVLHLGKATVPEDVFSNLHHPASPSKWSYFLSQTGDWHADTVLDSPCQEIYLTRTGSRANQPNKCVAVAVVPEGTESVVQQSHRVGYTALNTNQYQRDFPQNYADKINNEYLLLRPLLNDMQLLFRNFRAKMGEPVDSFGRRKKAIVMVANEGVMDLLLNFMCSAESTNVDISSVIVFVGEERYVSLIENMGATAMYHPALGSMPKHAAKGYLDETFSRMMWFKTTSVFLALNGGFDVLFQDVDLAWLKDPFPYFEGLDEDILFMDDGARTPRYTPFFVNSGFYFVKYNARTLYLFEKMMKCGASEIGQTHSHQSVLIRHIAEAHHLMGLKVYVLDTTLFPSGQTYHEKKKQVEKIQKRTFRPYVFHMCWTSNRVDKVVYFKDIGLWFLPGASKLQHANTDTCTEGRQMLNYAVTQGRGSANIRDKCCLRGRYWPHEGAANSTTVE